MATFGKTDRGAKSVLFPTSSSTVSACRFTLNDNNAVISKMTFYSSVLGTPAATSIKGLIYEVGGDGLPASLIAVTAQASVGTGANISIDALFTPPHTLNAGDYFLGIMANAPFVSVGSTIGSGTLLNPVSSVTSTYPTVSSPFPSVVTLSTNQKTVYATYTVDTPTDGFTISII